jgi:hypothetical protein
MRLSNSDPLCDCVAVPSGLTPLLGPLEPFCRDVLLIADEGALLPFRRVDVTVLFEPPAVNHRHVSTHASSEEGNSKRGRNQSTSSLHSFYPRSRGPGGPKLILEPIFEADFQPGSYG